MHDPITSLFAIWDTALSQREGLSPWELSLLAEETLSAGAAYIDQTHDPELADIHYEFGALEVLGEHEDIYLQQWDKLGERIALAKRRYSSD